MDYQNSNSNDDQNLSSWRIMRECRRVTREHGFVGDALTDNPKAGSFQQELWIVFLLGLIDLRIARFNMPFVKRVIRNIVCNSRSL